MPDGGGESARGDRRGAARISGHPWALMRPCAHVCWTNWPPFERHAGALIELLALENGKIKPEAHFEVSMVPSKLRYYAAAKRPAERRGRTSLALRAARADGRRRHHRAVEFPVVLMVRSLAPALAAGTTTIKMPGQTADQCTRVPDPVRSAVAAARVINLFSESGADGSKILIASPTCPSSASRPTATGRAISAVGAQRLSVSVSNSAERRRRFDD